MFLLIYVLRLCLAQYSEQGRFLNIYSTNYYEDDFCLLYPAEEEHLGRHNMRKRSIIFPSCLYVLTHY